VAPRRRCSSRLSVDEVIMISSGSSPLQVESWPVLGQRRPAQDRRPPPGHLLLDGDRRAAHHDAADFPDRFQALQSLHERPRGRGNLKVHAFEYKPYANYYLGEAYGRPAKLQRFGMLRPHEGAETTYRNQHGPQETPAG